MVGGRKELYADQIVGRRSFRQHVDLLHQSKKWRELLACRERDGQTEDTKGKIGPPSTTRFGYISPVNSSTARLVVRISNGASRKSKDPHSPEKRAESRRDPSDPLFEALEVSTDSSRRPGVSKDN